MVSNTSKASEILIKRGNYLFEQPFQRNEFAYNDEADGLLNDLERFPHAFVLASLMDRQIRAERAWLIPYKISRTLGTFAFPELLKVKQEQYQTIFNGFKLHRFNEMMSKIFYLGIQTIHNKYDDDASNIWKNNPGSATVVLRFLSFSGAGIKIATMATNILARDFKIPMKDHLCIDISPDRHIKRVFGRLGFVSNDANNEEVIYAARDLNPEYPGIFDLSCWEIGRNWCKPGVPLCKECYLTQVCPNTNK